MTSNTLAAPVPTVVEKIGVGKTGNIQGTITNKSSHNFAITGYANTSHGLVTTTVAQQNRLLQRAVLQLTNIEYEQNIKQATTVHSVVTTTNPNGKNVTTVNHDWPLLLDILVQLHPDGSESQIVSSNQYFEADEVATHNRQATNFSLLKDRVTTTDTLNFDASGGFTGNTNQPVRRSISAPTPPAIASAAV